MLAAPGSLLWTHDALQAQAPRAFPYYLDPSLRAVCASLRASPGPGTAIVLTTAEMGQLIPTCARVRVYVGHPQLTPRYAERAWEAGQVLGPGAAEKKRRFLATHPGVTHILLEAAKLPAWQALLRSGALEQQLAEGPWVILRRPSRR